VHSDGRPSIYLCGNSLGCMPRAVAAAMSAELDDWARLGVEGHFKARDNWYRYHELIREPLARLVGALPHEVVAMNSLTTNLHLLMTSFYRPSGKRRAILIDGPCFPSDVYAVKSQLRLHGVTESDGLVWARPRAGEHTLRAEDVIAKINEHADRLALVMLAGVNYVTGQFMDISAITAAARHHGITVGWDLAHAAGNVPLRLHDWGPDFAVWCSYKYLNSGPGAVAGAFVHERHTKLADAAARKAMPRLEGWWGNDPDSRFAMTEEFVPIDSADAWQLSNPPVLALVPLKVSLGIFDEAGMEALRQRSEMLTGALDERIREIAARTGGFEIITPRDPAARGCQLSIRVRGDAQALHRRLQDAGVICDFRRPDVIRVAPTPLYNTMEDVEAFASVLAASAG
jgi:kynureninase